MINNISNAELLKEFDKYVVGHTQAKKMLISLVNRSKLAHHHKYITLENLDNKIGTINCLLLGPSGTGKTHLVKTLQYIVEFPLVCLDATTLGLTSSNGIDKADIIKMIQMNAEYEMKQNPHLYFSSEGTIDQTIVFIDEIDKIAKPFDSTGEWNNRIQASLLTLLEGGRGLDNVSFILSGAFTGIREDSFEKRSIGFNSVVSIDKRDAIGDKEIIKYGLTPEFVGRINSIIELEHLDNDKLNEILERMLIPSYIEQMKLLGIDANNYLTDEVKKDIVNNAYISGQGVRSMKRDLTKHYNELEFNYEEDTSLLLTNK